MSANARSQSDPARFADQLGDARPRPGAIQPAHSDRTIPASTARLMWAAVVSAAQYQGRRIVLTRHGEPVAVLVPVSDLAKLERAKAAG